MPKDVHGIHHGMTNRHGDGGISHAVTEGWINAKVDSAEKRIKEKGPGWARVLRSGQRLMVSTAKPEEDSLARGRMTQGGRIGLKNLENSKAAADALPKTTRKVAGMEFHETDYSKATPDQMGRVMRTAGAASKIDRLARRLGGSSVIAKGQRDATDLGLDREQGRRKDEHDHAEAHPSTWDTRKKLYGPSGTKKGASKKGAK